MKKVYFFIGTEAELIKIFPIMVLAKSKNVPYKIIASGQNDIGKSKILKAVGEEVDIELSNHSEIKKSPTGLFSWFIKTYFKAKKILKKEELANNILIIHGDTVSTVLGAKLGKDFKMKVMHVEAGLRSYDFLNPFPEEIDRIIASRYTDIHCAPNEEAYNNLKKQKGKKINTHLNTIIDSLCYSRTVPINNSLIIEVQKDPYFVFVMHRQENLANKQFVEKIVDQIIELSKSMKCVVIMHELTKITLKNLGLLSKIENENNIVCMPRVEYFDFMKLLDKSQFVITDGGSNQEELYYMGKPCLLLRKKTERNEGLGKNAIMYNGEPEMLKTFLEEYKKYEIEPVTNQISPSKIIIDELLKI